MANKVLFGYLGAFTTWLIILDIIEKLSDDDNLQKFGYRQDILFIIAGIFWGIYGIQNKLLPTTFISLFQAVVFIFIFIIKYNKINSKDGFAVDRAKISRMVKKDKTRKET